MTSDVIALLAAAPSGDDLVAALTDAAPELTYGSIRGGSVLEVVDADYATVLTIESARRVAVSGEATRLLDIADEPEPPYWWVELRCPAPRRDGRDLASAIADGLVAKFGGTVWHGAAERDGGGGT